MEVNGRKESFTWLGSTTDRHVQERNINTMKTCGQDYIVGIAIRYRLVSPGIISW